MFNAKALYPTAVFSIPEVFAFNDAWPIAVLLPPVVLLAVPPPIVTPVAKQTPLAQI